MSPVVSIIMPAYNAEAYIQEAIQSVIAQTMTDWELIVVDDGSCDNTASLLDVAACQDARIKVIHQPNAGVAAARQVGVDAACGEYCIHVDADDWVEPDYLESLTNMARQTQADLVWCDAFTETANQSSVWKMTLTEPTADAMLRGILLQQFWGMLWNKLVRTDICRQESVRFPIGCTMWEDMAYVVQCLLHSASVAYVSQPLYHYRQTDASLTHQNSSRVMCYEYQKAVSAIDAAIDARGVRPRYERELNRLKLEVVRDYIDDLRIRDYDQFMRTYPEAVAHLNDYADVPLRIKLSAWLIAHGFRALVAPMCKLDAQVRKLRKLPSV